MVSMSMLRNCLDGSNEVVNSLMVECFAWINVTDPETKEERWHSVTEKSRIVMELLGHGKTEDATTNLLLCTMVAVLCLDCAIEELDNLMLLKEAERTVGDA